jgi:hypothetical protein
MKQIEILKSAHAREREQSRGGYRNESKRHGRMAFALLGTLAMIAWCLQARAWDPSTLLLILLAGATLSLWTWSDAHHACGATVSSAGAYAPMDRKRARPSVRQRGGWGEAPAAGLLEGGLCFCGLAFNLALLLVLLGHLPWLGAALTLVLGLLCLPIGEIQGQHGYYWTGVALIVLALTGSWLSFAGAGAAAECFGAGGVCWLSVLCGF